MSKSTPPHAPRQRTAARPAPVAVDVAAPGVIHVGVGPARVRYSLAEIESPADDARVFAVRSGRMSRPFLVTVGAPADRSCSCPTWTARGRCRHLAALLSLDAAGRLDEASGADEWTAFDGVGFTVTATATAKE